MYYIIINCALWSEFLGDPWTFGGSVDTHVCDLSASTWYTHVTHAILYVWHIDTVYKLYLPKIQSNQTNTSINVHVQTN